MNWNENYVLDARDKRKGTGAKIVLKMCSKVYEIWHTGFISNEQNQAHCTDDEKPGANMTSERDVGGEVQRL